MKPKMKLEVLLAAYELHNSVLVALVRVTLVLTVAMLVITVFVYAMTVLVVTM